MAPTPEAHPNSSPAETIAARTPAPDRAPRPRRCSSASKLEIASDKQLAASSFRAAWPGIKVVLATADVCRIDHTLVHPSLGVLVFDNPGATVNVYHFAHLDEFFRDPSASLEPAEPSDDWVGSDYPKFIGCTLRVGSLPTYDCNTARWSPAGCIHTGRVSLTKAEPALRLNDPAETDPELGQKVHRIEHLITDAISNDTRYYFGRVDGAWRLLAIDIVTPCSA